MEDCNGNERDARNDDVEMRMVTDSSALMLVICFVITYKIHSRILVSPGPQLEQRLQASRNLPSRAAYYSKIQI